jgi:hypothetical protein
MPIRRYEDLMSIINNIKTKIGFPSSVDIKIFKSNVLINRKKELGLQVFHNL